MQDSVTGSAAGLRGQLMAQPNAGHWILARSALAGV